MRLNTFEEIGQALTEAIEWCKVYGLNWRRHVQPIFKNGQIAGYVSRLRNVAYNHVSLFSTMLIWLCFLAFVVRSALIELK